MVVLIDPCALCAIWCLRCGVELLCCVVCWIGLDIIFVLS